MILQHFSWQGFLVFFLVISFLWYAAVLLLFYRKSLLTFFNSKFLVSDIVLQRSAVPDRKIGGVSAAVDTTDASEPEVMGKSRLPEGMSLISADLIRFSKEVATVSSG